MFAFGLCVPQSENLNEHKIILKIKKTTSLTLFFFHVNNYIFVDCIVLYTKIYANILMTDIENLF